MADTKESVLQELRAFAPKPVGSPQGQGQGSAVPGAGERDPEVDALLRQLRSSLSPMQGSSPAQPSQAPQDAPQQPQQTSLADTAMDTLSIPESIQSAFGMFLTTAVGPQVARQLIEKPGETAAQVGAMALTGGVGAAGGMLTNLVLKPFVRMVPSAARYAPILSEMAGSYISRRFGVETGLEEEGSIGDIASIAMPLVGAGARTMASKGIINTGAAKTFARPLDETGAAALAPYTDTIAEPQLGAVRRALAPQKSLRVTRLQEAYRTSGEVVKEAFWKSREQFQQMNRQLFDPVRQGIEEKLGKGVRSMIDITDLEARAQKLGTTLQAIGVEFQAKPKMVLKNDGSWTQDMRYYLSFDDAQKARTQLRTRSGYKAPPEAANLGNKISMATIEGIRDILDTRMEKVAADAGMLNSWREANKVFIEEYVPRFANKGLNDMAAKSAEEIIDKAPGMSVDQVNRFMDSLANVVTENAPDALRTIKTADGKVLRIVPGAAREELKKGFVQKIMANSLDPSGTLSPRKLHANLSQIHADKRRAILGDDAARALELFADNLRRAQNSTMIGIGVVGGTAAGAATGAMMGAPAAGGGIGMGAGAVAGFVTKSMMGGVETANEFGMLGRLMVQRPKYINALIDQVLKNKPGAAREFTRETGLTLAGSNAVRNRLMATEETQHAGGT